MGESDRARGTSRRSQRHLTRVWKASTAVVGGLAGCLGLLSAIRSLQRSTQFIEPTDLFLLGLVVVVGLLAAGLHGVFWSLLERKFGWRFGAGGGAQLPSGISAVVLSLGLTSALLIAPGVVDLFYDAFTDRRFLPAAHWRYGWILLIGGVIGHLIMYGIGSGSLRGVRQRLMPAVGWVSIPRAVAVEGIYGAVYFSTIAVPYRLLASLSRRGLLGSPAVGALLFIVAMAIFIMIRYPDSVEDPTWVQFRGGVSGVVLSLCLTGAMLF